MEYDEKYHALIWKYGSLLAEAQKIRDEIRPIEKLGFEEGFIFTEEGHFTTPSSGVDLIGLQEELESIEKEIHKTIRDLQRHVLKLERKAKIRP